MDNTSFFMTLYPTDVKFQENIQNLTDSNRAAMPRTPDMSLEVVLTRPVQTLRKPGDAQSAMITVLENAVSMSFRTYDRKPWYAVYRPGIGETRVPADTVSYVNVWYKL